jgi:hypothetical protein
MRLAEARAEEHHRHFFRFRRLLENSDIAVGVLAVNDLAPGWRVHGESLGSDRHPSIVADPDPAALAEDVGPGVGNNFIPLENARLAANFFG